MKEKVLTSGMICYMIYDSPKATSKFILKENPI